MVKQANPQGKGLVPVLETLTASRALVTLPAKNIHQISSELFTSLFVLHSQFSFKPVVGKSYWLYYRNNTFQLSLISPEQWGEHSATVVGECVMHEDISWTLSLHDDAFANTFLMSKIDTKRQELENSLQGADTLEQILPFYIEGLPFYQRVYAAALAHSLKGSMVKSGINQLNYHQAEKYLPAS